MALRMNKRQARAYGVKPKATKPSAKERFGGYRSGWEQEYAANLEKLRMRGNIRSWSYEPITLRLAERTTYTPDFLVEGIDGILEFREVKGLARAAGMVKVKVAARQFPMFHFLLVRKVNGMWDYEEVPR